MPLVRARSPQINTDRSINVAGASLGAVAAGAVFTGFTNSACTVSDANNWTTPTASLRYLIASDSKNHIVITDDSARDAEVTTWSRNGTVFFRVASGRAIYFQLNQETANGTLTVGICTGLTFGTSNYAENFTGYSIYTNSNLVSSVGLDKDDTEGDTWTFGVDGFDVYMKFNGTEFERIQEYRHMVSGQVVLQANTGYGFRNVSLDWLHPRKLRSNPSAGILDLRDLGLKELLTTGSISATSNQLVMTTNPGFSVGDPIIVAVGGEAGAGARGTAGVGGTWPALSYANTTAMNADTGQANNTFAWVQSTGDVYQYNSGTLTWAQPVVTSYYIRKVIPKALRATITAINGLTATISTSATNTATAANIYYDNQAVFNDVSDGTDQLAIVPSDIQLRMPAGNFAVSDKVNVEQRNGWQSYGAGSTATMLFSPNGAPSAGVRITSCDSALVRDFHLKGNARDNGFGLAWFDFVTETSTPQGTTFPGGVHFSTSDDVIAQDMIVTDVWQKAFGADFCNDPWCYRVTAYQTNELKQYLQWHFQIADSEGGGVVDCVVDSEFLLTGFETFGSNGQTFTNCSGRNTVFSCNSAGSYLFENCETTIEANSQGPELAFSTNNPCFNVNANIGTNGAGVALGGTITNFIVTHEGTVDGTNGLQCINVGASNPNIHIDGATLTHPNYSRTGATGIDQNASGTTLTINDITVVGTNNNASWGNISVAAGTTYNLANLSAGRILVGGVQVFP